MAHVVDHLSVPALQEGYRTSSNAVSARHYHTIWLLAQGRTIAETSALTSFAPRWIEELLARYNAFGPSALVFWHIYKIPIFRQIRFIARHEEHQGLLIRQPR
jgi:hypothetical protein